MTYSEKIQWKIGEVRKYLNKEEFIMHRLETQMSAISKTLSTLSSEILQLSELFKQLEIQEDMITSKLGLGISWKSKKKNEKKKKENSTSNAWQFGIDICKKWSLFTSMQKTVFENEFSVYTKDIWKKYRNLDTKIFKDQETINGDFIYREKNFKSEKTSLINKSPVEKWELQERWDGNEALIQALKEGKKWAVDVVKPRRSRLFWHFSDYFRSSNKSSFLQFENFRMHINCCYYKAFKKWNRWMKDAVFLITDF
jgi:regulator of replication initiation timing